MGREGGQNFGLRARRGVAAWANLDGRNQLSQQCGLDACEM